MKRLIRIAVYFCVPLLLLLLIFGALLGTKPGLTFTASMINRLASTSERTITITDLSNVLAGTPSVGQLSVGDADGVWLEATGIQSRINLLALLSSKIEIGLLSAQSIEVKRQPIASTNPGENTSEGGLLPAIDLAIDSLFVKSMHLSQPVLGEEATLQVTGAMRLQDMPINLSGQLEVLRIDGTKGDISAKWTISPDKNELSLDLEANEPSNGLIARAADIPGLPSIGLKVVGYGPLTAWNASLSVDLDGSRTVDGAVELSLSDQRQSISGTLKGKLAPLLPTPVKPLFAGDTDIQLSAERDNKKSLIVKQFSARSSLLDVELDGHVLPDANAVDVNASITFGRADSVVAVQLSDTQTVDVGLTRVRSNLKGTLDNADWSFDGSVASISDGTISASGVVVNGQSNTVDFRRENWPLDVRIVLAGLTTGQDDLDALLKGEVRGNVKLLIARDLVKFDTMQVAAREFTVEGTGQLVPTDRTFDAAVTGRLLEQKSGVLAMLFGTKGANISAQIDRQQSGRMALSQLKLTSGNLQASGGGTFESNTVSADADLSLDNLALIRDGLSGALAIKARVNGDIAAPEFELNADGRDLTVLGQALEAFSLVASGIASGTSPQADVKLSGRYEDQPVTLSARVKTATGGSVVVETLDVAAPGARGQGKFQSNAAGVLTGKLDIDITSLEEFGPLLLQSGLSGAVDGSLELEDTANGQQLSANLNVPALSVGGSKVSDMAVRATISDLQSEPSIDVQASAGSIDAGGSSLSNIQATAKGTVQDLPFTIGGQFMNGPLNVAGRYIDQERGRRVELNRIEANIRSIPVKLTEPMTISLGQSATQVEKATIRIGSGVATIEGAISDQLSIDVSVNDLPIALAENVAATGLGQSGTLSGTATIRGKPSQPDVDYELSITNFSVSQSRQAQIPTINVNSAGKLRSNKLTTTAQATGSGLDMKLSGTVDLGNGPALNLDISGTAPFGFAALPLSDAGIQLDGAVQISVRVAGTAQNPRITGNLSTSDAVFIESNSLLTVRQINAQVSFDGTKADIVRLDGRLGSKGTVSIGGYVIIDPAENMPANLTLTVQNGTYTNGELVTAQFGADMRVVGALLGSGKIDGSVKLTRTDINIPESLPASIPFVDVKHKNASKQIIAQAKEFDTSANQSESLDNSGGLLLDVAVESPARIFLRGRGIDAEFGGSVQITGTTRAPRVRGNFQMARGRIDILTKRFDFDRGTITFAGQPDPLLDFQTTTTQSGASYSILVGGTASAPDISFSSSPSMPQDEILANLFFAKGLSKLSPFQIAQLASAVASISGVSSGPGVLDRLRNLGGLADLDINSNGEDGGSAIGIGRYLNDRTYINIEKGLSDDAGKVTIDLDLTDNLKARGEADTDGNSKAGLFFERDY